MLNNAPCASSKAVSVRRIDSAASWLSLPSSRAKASRQAR